MYIIRKSFELLYDYLKSVIFAVTKNDPEKAHEVFVMFCRALYKAKLDKAFFDYPKNTEFKRFEFSNAAGFNKNAEIPPYVLYYLGFNRAVIGSVTGEPYGGNSRPRCQRYEATQSIVNRLGLPSEGAQKVAQRLLRYEASPIPLTINFAATPTKKWDQITEDLLSTIQIMKNVKKVDRFELNISCPNVSSSAEYEIEALDEILSSVCDKLEDKKFFLKISPDVDKEYANRIVLSAQKYKIAGFVIANTTKRYVKKYIPQSLWAGGASGKAVYQYSTDTQRLFENIIEKNNFPQKIIACGGIDSVKKVKERLSSVALGIQIYTPFVFYGPKIIRSIKTEDADRRMETG
ncbi:MAG: hypothetical protein JRJ44_06015 [Deltaproteobacteria bacterium]|nr:hypothetical protein [Deltaproteobacteria bacterium]